MCLIVFAYKKHPKYKLILAANRDEFYERPTSVAGWWEDKPTVLGGRDLKAKGTWMAVDRKGRFAAVTNYRDLSNLRDDAKSRGDLPVNFLEGNGSSSDYTSGISGKNYNGFNFLAMDEEMVHTSNFENKLNVLTPGIYGLSNALLDTSWPKVSLAKSTFQKVISDQFGLSELITVMQNEHVASDDDLPKTGLPLEMERAVSAMCIRTPTYGTCCSTAILIDYEGNVSFQEESYPIGNRKSRTVSFSFKAEPDEH